MFLQPKLQIGIVLKRTSTSEMSDVVSFIVWAVYVEEIRDRKCTILGLVCVEGQWRSWYNDELYEMYDDPTVDQLIKLVSLRWAEHVVRIETDYPS